MDKTYDHKLVEDKIYQTWENGGYFQPETNPHGKPYSIILPPPNANGDLHFGHAMFVVEDILIRYHRMLGEAALWLPGTDHAGTETQFVYEKKLQLDGKSRFDFSREELYQHIWDYVQENRGGIQKQLKRLGFSLDWTREKFTLDPDVVKIVKETFRKMYTDNLIYRDYRLVNYCTRDGTSFSDLEVVSEEASGEMYIIHYPIKGTTVLDGADKQYIPIATTRPETMFGDQAIMVHPDDARYKEFVGKTALIPLINKEIPIITDEAVDMSFGTGAVKVTPAHDFTDYEVGKRHNLSLNHTVVGFDGKMKETSIVDGLYVKQARPIVIEKLKEKDLLGIITSHKMIIKKCYKCKTVLEPLPLEQWYIKVQPLIENANKAVDAGLVKIYPDNFVHILKQWYAGLRDWNISRQNVWGIQIPVWYEVHDAKAFTVSFINKEKRHTKGTLDEVLQTHSFEEILSGLQTIVAPITAKVVFEDEKEKGKQYLPETDTFDTWFSSGQWPYVTLKTTKPGDFEKFYPTSVMETGYDILRAWVSRMLMLGLYVANGKHETDIEKLKKTVPFRDVVLHGLVNDPLGKKMSKSKGNVVNPLEVADQYGADSVRFALVYGTGLGNDQAMSYAKLDAARKFTNKLWNMARFLEMKKPEGMGKVETYSLHELTAIAENQADKDMLEETKRFAQEITDYLEKYQFNLAAERLYDFTWHTIADKYIEEVKNRMDEKSYIILSTIYAQTLALLHPFMPFVTEEIYQKMNLSNTPLIVAPWPKS